MGEAKNRLKVGFVYNGPVDDAGHTRAHDIGRREMETALPGVETACTESVPIPDAQKVIEDYAQKCYDLIFTNTFCFMDATYQVAEKFPEVVFMQVNGVKVRPNMGNYVLREYHGFYLTGLVAGRVTRTNLIGFVVSRPIHLILGCINGFALGVREVNPKAGVRVIFTGSFHDPARAQEAAERLLDEGADIITNHQNGPEPVQLAEQRGKYAIGNNWDMSRFAPEGHLTAVLFKWNVFFEGVAKTVLAGTWTSERIFWGLERGAIDISPLHPVVPDEARRLVEVKKKQIASGAFDVFHGPLKDQSGMERVAAGRRATDEELLSMDYLLDIVEGTIPK